MDYMCKLKSISLFLVVVSLFFSGFISAEEIRIALRANNGSIKGLEKWQATADYLSKKIPGYQFTIVPFENNSALNQAVSRGTFHFCITNPASGIEHKIRYGAEPLATLVNKRQGKGYSEFGSVIFARADRRDVNTLQDLKGKMFTAVDELGFGGWRVAWLELLENDINPYTDFTELHFAGGNQQDVVYAVRDKIVAAGSVRTDTLERMAASGKININNFKILAQKKSKNFPFLHSTKLYPEWMFSAVIKTDEKLKKDVIKALFSIHKNSLVAKNGKYIGWIDPLDYSPVDDLLKKLKVGPYNVATMDYFKGLVLQYGMIVVVTLIIISILILSILYVLMLNKQILHAKELLKQETETSKKLEIQLLHSQRIESLGRLTGGIAHDFNNKLAGILGFTELALDTDIVKNDKTLTKYLSLVVDTSEKCAGLVAQMLAFSRAEEGDSKKELISVVSVFNNIKRLLQPIIQKEFTVNVNEPNEELFVNANSVMISQVLMTLYLNAKDAIQHNNGTITIDSNVVSIGDENKKCSSCHQNIHGEYIEISVEDNGCGIDTEIIEHLFEPFFTTKEVNKGTGMGLSEVHGVIHRHNGHILFESNINKGSIIKILLPKKDKNDYAYDDTKNNLILNNNKHIVVVDDEVSFTIYVTDILNMQGFKVTAFNDSQEALAYMKNNIDNIDLVVTDQIMPNLNGLELSNKILELNNDTPIILCSGLRESFEEIADSELSKITCIEKPVRAEQLIDTIGLLLK